MAWKPGLWTHAEKNKVPEMCFQAGSGPGSLWRQKGAPDCGRLGWPRGSDTSFAGECSLGELSSPWGRENHRIEFIYLLPDKILPRRLWMVILCNYISFEVLQALRHINSLLLIAYLEGVVVGKCDDQPHQPGGGN